MTNGQRKSMRAIFQHTAAQHGLCEADLYVRNRKASVVRARWAAWALCRDFGHTLQAIADLAGWDHTTVMHGVAAHKGAAK